MRRRGWSAGVVGAWAMLAVAACSTSDGSASVSAEIGAAGGTVSLDGASFTIPAGALSSPTLVTVAVASDSLAGGQVLSSRVYAFSGGAASLLSPATASIRIDSPTAAPVFMWQPGSSGSFGPLPSIDQGGWLRATVSGFGTGFVTQGAILDAAIDDSGGADASDATLDSPADADATAPSDASVDSPADADASGPADASVDSPVDADASGPADGGACVVSPTAALIGDITAPTASDLIGSGLFFCSADTYDYTFTLAQPAILVAAQHHMLAPPITSFGFVDGCSSSASVLASASTYSLAAALVPAGTYGFVYCDTSGSFYVAMHVESPPPTATNTSCSSPQPLPYTEPRVIDGQPRVYSFSAPGSTIPSLTIGSPDTAGSTLNVSVRSMCNDPATEVASLQVPLWAPGPLAYSLSTVLAAGTYYVVVTNIGNGDTFSIQ